MASPPAHEATALGSPAPGGPPGPGRVDHGRRQSRPQREPCASVPGSALGGGTWVDRGSGGERVDTGDRGQHHGSGAPRAVGGWGCQQPPWACSGRRPHTPHPCGAPTIGGHSGTSTHTAGCGPTPFTSARADSRLPGPGKLPTRRTSVNFALGERSRVFVGPNAAAKPSWRLLRAPTSSRARTPGSCRCRVPDGAPSLPREAARAPKL